MYNKRRICEVIIKILLRIFEEKALRFKVMFHTDLIYIIFIEVRFGVNIQNRSCRISYVSISVRNSVCSRMYAYFSRFTAFISQ